MIVAVARAADWAPVAIPYQLSLIHIYPAYTGMPISHLGFVLFFYNHIALALLLAFFIPTVIARILVEEKMLFDIDGYKEFAAGRARLLPFIW